MLHLDTPLSFAILSESCRIWEQSAVSHPKFFVDFHFAATQIFTECFDLVQISQHNENYRMIPFYWYVLCMGTLLCWHAYDVMFMGCDSHFGMQKNYATTTLHLSRRQRLQRKAVWKKKEKCQRKWLKCKEISSSTLYNNSELICPGRGVFRAVFMEKFVIFSSRLLCFYTSHTWSNFPSC